MIHLLDSNVFIQAKRLHYGFDFCPGFWDWIDRAHGDNAVLSIDAVFDELKDGKDDLAKWVASRTQLFAPADADRLRSMAILSNWATSTGLPYSQTAVQDFLASADYQLVAHAHAHGHTVVTHELPNQAGRKRVKIPEACNAVGVKYVQPHELLRRQNARFDLRPAA